MRRLFNTVQTKSYSFSTEYGLQLTVKAVNDTTGTLRIVATLLVFGVEPRVLLSPGVFSKHVERMKIMKDGRKKMITLYNKAKRRTAAWLKVPRPLVHDYVIGDQVLMNRENAARKWRGPYIVQIREEKLLSIDNGDRVLHNSVDKVKLYTEHDPQ